MPVPLPFRRSSDRGRTCVWCRRALRSDNTTGVCSACQRRPAQARRVARCVLGCGGPATAPGGLCAPCWTAIGAGTPVGVLVRRYRGAPAPLYAADGDLLRCRVPYCERRVVTADSDGYCVACYTRRHNERKAA